MPDIESVSALNVVVLNLSAKSEPPLAARWLRPVEVVDNGRRCLSTGICNLHAGAEASLRHLTLSAKLCRRNCNLRTWHNPNADAHRFVMQVAQHHGLAAREAEDLNAVTGVFNPRNFLVEHNNICQRRSRDRTRPLPVNFHERRNAVSIDGLC